MGVVNEIGSILPVSTDPIKQQIIHCKSGYNKDYVSSINIIVLWVLGEKN